MRIVASTEYALQAAAELAADQLAGGELLSRNEISEAQGIPPKFLPRIMSSMIRAGLVESRRGTSGGYWLAYPADEIVLADVVRAVEGPLVHVRGVFPEEVEYPGAAKGLQPVWIALRSSLRSVLERVSLEDVVYQTLPEPVASMTRDSSAWRHHPDVTVGVRAYGWSNQVRVPQDIRHLVDLERSLSG
jgi:Rrf2 family protein